MRKAKRNENYVTRYVTQKRSDGTVVGQAIPIKLDADVASYFDKYEWHIRYNPTLDFYQIFRSYKKPNSDTPHYWLLHRWIYGIKPRQGSSTWVTFKNGDHFDYRKENLELRGAGRHKIEQSLFDNPKTELIKKNKKYTGELIKYIRDKKRNPIGCVVAKGPNETDINWSMCAKEDQFTKNVAKKVAKGRIGIPYPITFLKGLSREGKSAVSELNLHEAREFYENWYNVDEIRKELEPQRVHRFKILQSEIENMKERANKYFK